MTSALLRDRRDSLAGRLTRTLILWVGGVWLLCVLAVVWYVDREINHNFDNELVEVSHRMFDMAVQELEKLRLRHESGKQDTPLIAPKQLFSEDAVMYQVVDVHEHVLLRSAEAPTMPSTCRWPPASPTTRLGASTPCATPRWACTSRWPTRSTSAAAR